MKELVCFLDLAKINARFRAEFSDVFLRVTDRGRYLCGEQTKAFEDRFASFCGVAHCIGVANGMDALTLALLARKQLEAWDDDTEVIIPAHTFVATAQAVVRAGLRPVLADVGDDGLLVADAAERVITSRTRALIPVHLYGKLCDMPPLLRIAQKHRLFVLEDAAQAHGAQRAGRRAGAWGDAAAFSFYPGKNLGALGDGGAVTTNDARLSDRVRCLGNYGAPRKYYHEYLGLNSRLDELQAALLSIKLNHLAADNARRRDIARRYISEISHKRFTLPYSSADDVHEDHVFHIFPLRIAQRDELRSYLSAQGVETLIHYPLPIHRQECLRDYFSHSVAYPKADMWANCELSLPISPVMTDEEVDHVVQTLNRY